MFSIYTCTPTSLKQPPAWHCPDVNYPLHAWSLSTHIPLKSIPHPCCPWFGCKNKIKFITFWYNEVLMQPFVLGLNSKQWVMLCHLKQNVSATKQCARKAVSLLPWEKCCFWKCWVLLVKSWFFSGCTTQKRRGSQIPENCQMVQTVCLTAERPDGCQWWSVTAASWEFDNLWFKSVNIPDLWSQSPLQPPLPKHIHKTLRSPRLRT